jgi:hypothetical protein
MCTHVSHRHAGAAIASAWLTLFYGSAFTVSVFSPRLKWVFHLGVVFFVFSAGYSVHAAAGTYRLGVAILRLDRGISWP